MCPERRVALREHGVVKGTHRELAGLAFLVVTPQLQEHEFPDRVDEIGGIERPSFCFPARRGFLEERLVAEESHALLDERSSQCRRMATTKRTSRTSVSASWPSLIVTSPRLNPTSAIICSQ